MDSVGVLSRIPWGDFDWKLVIGFAGEIGMCVCACVCVPQLFYLRPFSPNSACDHAMQGNRFVGLGSFRSCVIKIVTFFPILVGCHPSSCNDYFGQAFAFLLH